MFAQFSIDSPTLIPIADEEYPWSGVFPEGSYTLDEVVRVKAAMHGMHISGDPLLFLPVDPDQLGLENDRVMAGAGRFMLFRVYYLKLGEKPLEIAAGMDRAENEDSLHTWANWEAISHAGFHPRVFESMDDADSWRTGPLPEVPAALAATRAGAFLLQDWQERVGRAMAIEVLRNGFAPMVESWPEFVPMLNREWNRYAEAIPYPK